MKFPSYLRRRRLERLLSYYPLYSPPVFGDASEFSEEEIMENFTYFFNERKARVRALKNLLSDFSIDLDLGISCVDQIGDWIHKYGRCGIKERNSHFSALVRFSPLWSKELAILNVIFDLSIFAGDLIISNCSDAKWKPLTTEDSAAREDMVGFGQACLYGVSHQSHGYPVYLPEKILDCFEGARNFHRDSLVFSEWYKPSAFGNLIKSLIRFDQSIAY